MKLIILDRDGVINFDSLHYIKNETEWHPIPGSLEAIARLNQLGFQIAVATNQSGISRGLYTEADLHDIHQKMHQAVEAQGGKIAQVFYCPHHPDDQCACRKPEPGLLQEIAAQFACTLDQVPFVGDSWRDLVAGQKVGASPVLVLTGNGQKTWAMRQPQVKQFPVFSNLLAFANSLKS